MCVEVEARVRVFWELNKFDDVARIEAVTNCSEFSADSLGIGLDEMDH